ncbi:hypothetical protein pipiens_017175 [Culex pipiens pipiens]|uniref:DNA helicase MCM9 n=1 Tax=Culex pipiens pipiens TaxID=38569 RepID=A0ABD1CHS4_CULPP
MELFYNIVSPPSRSVLMLAKHLGIESELTMKSVNLRAGEHMTEDYVRMNPQHCVPTLLTEDGVAIWESNAILIYLAERFDNEEQVYSKDLAKRAQINQRLCFDLGTLYKNIRAYYGPLAMGRSKPSEDLLKQIDQSVGYLEGFLSKTKFVAADSLTIADFAVITSVTVASRGSDMACATDKMEAQIERYLTTYHDGQITELLNKPDEMLHASVGVSLTHLARNEPSLYDALTARPTLELAKWDRSLWQAQMSRVEGPYLSLEAGFQLKHNCHVRFTSMPTSSSQREHGAKKNKGTYPKLDQLGRLVEVSGTVVRMTRSPKFVEFKRDYVCNRCRLEFVVEALYAEKYVFVVPRACPNATETGCKGTPKQKNDQPLPDYCHSCQEIRIQKDAGHSNSANSIEVTLENDLVDSCLPGDRVRIIGTVELRSSPGIVGKQTELTLTLNANSLTKDGHTMNNNEKNFAADLCLVRTEWQGTVDEIGELAARDLLVQSICPEIHGMYPVKLAIVLALASCAQRDLGNTTVTRLSSHLLLVGDPGLAKSRLLRFAADVSSRSVFTTGTGCSAAGLTAAAVQEDGEWQLEAGALVIADGGICCIDEFSSMQKKDMASIHEAMEQQTISVAKAGIRCTLAARCTILAATNPKTPFSVTDHAGASVNIGVEGPLLSRFDLVLLLRDQYDPEWYMAVCDHILSLSVVDEAKADFQQISPDSCWPMDTLQRHFRAIQQIDPKFSEGAQTVLSK